MTIFFRTGINVKVALSFLVTLSLAASLNAQVPVITSFSPASGPVGTNVTITGSNFSPTAANNIVYFGAVKGIVVSATATSLLVKVPGGTSYKPVTVTVNGLTASASRPFIVTFPGGGDIVAGSLTTAGILTASKGAFVRWSVVEDFDGDGSPDIAVNNGDTTILTVFRNNGTSFDQGSNFSVNTPSNFLTAADIDGDGKKDLLIRESAVVGSSANAFKIGILRNVSTPGTISFQPRVDIQLSNIIDNRFAIADFDDDGKPDIATTISNNFDSVIIIKNTSTIGSISFSPTFKYFSAAGVNCTNLTAGDIDGDGRNDIIILNNAVSSAYIYRNTVSNGNASFNQAYILSTDSKPSQMALADLDGDGKPDLTFTNDQPAVFSVRKNQSTPGTFSFTSGPSTSLPDRPYAPTIADINGDGKPDVAITFTNSLNQYQDKVFLSKNTTASGNISFAPPATFSDANLGHALNPAFGDLNKDGKLEMVLPNSDNKKIVFTRNQMLSNYYSKDTGEFKNLGTWGLNANGSGQAPTDFGPAGIFHLANRTSYNLPLPSVYRNYLAGDWTVANLDIPKGVTLNVGSGYSGGDTLRVWDLPGEGTISTYYGANLAIIGAYGRDVTVRFSNNANRLSSLRIQRPVGSNTTVTSNVRIEERLMINSGNLNSGGGITFSYRAKVPAVPSTSKVTGLFTYEQSIYPRRAWRFLGTALQSSTSINSNWQEGVTTSSPNPNPAPGYGIQISGGSTSNGFDSGYFQSIKRYNNANDTWTPLSNTNATSVSAEPYMVFIGGDRSMPVSNTTSDPKPTTLRVKGTLRTGDQTYSVGAANYTAIANPYPMPVNFATMTKNNVQSNNFWIWNSHLDGNNTVGKWINISWNGTTWEPNPKVNTGYYGPSIEAGEAFMVSSTGAAGSLVIKESDKVEFGYSYLGQRQELTQRLRVSLYTKGRNDEDELRDEVSSSYDRKFSNNLDNYDVEKLNNFDENLAIVRSGKNLIVERKSQVASSDTMQLKLWNTEQKLYQLNIAPENLDASVASAVLEDAYLQTSVPIDLKSVTEHPFAVTADPVSQNPYRFRIILNAKPTSPVTSDIGEGIKVYPNPLIGKTIKIEFNNMPKGNYNVELFDSKGEKVLVKTTYNEGRKSTKVILLDGKLAKGVYLLQVGNGDVKKTFSVLSE